jgi:hypothetical protein
MDFYFLLLKNPEVNKRNKDQASTLEINKSYMAWPRLEGKTRA